MLALIIWDASMTHSFSETEEVVQNLMKHTAPLTVAQQT